MTRHPRLHCPLLGQQDIGSLTESQKRSFSVSPPVTSRGGRMESGLGSTGTETAEFQRIDWNRKCKQERSRLTILTSSLRKRILSQLSFCSLSVESKTCSVSTSPYPIPYQWRLKGCQRGRDFSRTKETLLFLKRIIVSREILNKEESQVEWPRVGSTCTNTCHEIYTFVYLDQTPCPRRTSPLPYCVQGKEPSEHDTGTVTVTGVVLGRGFTNRKKWNTEENIFTLSFYFIYTV